LNIKIAVVAVALGLAAGLPAQAESILVLNSEEASYSLLSRTQRTELVRLPLGREPHHWAVTPDGKEVLIASTVTNELVALDTTTAEKKRVVRDIIDPYQLAFSPDGKWFVTTAYRLDHVDIYHADGFKLASRTFIDGMPSHMAFDSDSKTVFVTLQQSNRVVAFDLATQMIKWNVEAGTATAGIVMLPGNKRLLVALTGEDAIVEMDPKDGSLKGRLQTGKGAHNFLAKGDGRHWFLSNRIENTISVIDTQEMKVVGSIRVNGGPDDMELTSGGKELWVTQRFLRRVAVVDLAQMKVVANIPVGKSPHGLFIFKGTATPAAGVPIRAASTEGDRK
jgi:DNA-binding beta-propeller fold protein YncE